MLTMICKHNDGHVLPMLYQLSTLMVFKVSSLSMCALQRDGAGPAS